MGQEKKITVRFDLTVEEQRRAYEFISKRLKTQYKSQSDYICAAILAFEGDEQRRKEQDIEQLCDKLIERLLDTVLIASQPGR